MTGAAEPSRDASIPARPDLDDHADVVEAAAVAIEQATIALEALAKARQLFDTINRVVRTHSPESPPPVVGKLAAVGTADVEWATTAAAWMPSGPRRPLHTSLCKLTAWIDQSTSITAFCQISGRARPVRPEVQRALYRVAYRCVGVARAAPRCSCIFVKLTRSDDELHLHIADDGVAMRPAADDHYPTLERLVRDVGGCLAVDHARPRMVIVTATVSADRAYA